MTRRRHPLALRRVAGRHRTWSSKTIADLSRYSPALASAGGVAMSGLLAATGHAHKGILVALAVVVFLLAFRWPLAVLGISLPALAAFPMMGSVPITFPVMTGLVLALLLVNFFRRRLRLSWMVAVGLLTLGWFALSLVHGRQDLPTSGSRWATLALVGLQFCLAMLAMGLPRIAESVLRVTALQGSLLGWMAFGGGPVSEYAGRYAAAGLNPNYAGLAVALGVVAAFMLYFKRERLLALATLPGLILGLGLTQSRGALVAAATGTVVVAFVCAGRPASRRAKLVVISLAAAATLSFVAVTLLRSGSWVQVSNKQREGLIGEALRLTRDHPVFGVGWLNFPSAAAPEASSGLALNTHNEYLRLASETGIVGVALFLTFVGLAVLAVRARGNIHLALPIVVTWLVGMLFVNGLATPAISLAPLLILGAAAGHRSGKPGRLDSFVDQPSIRTPKHVVLVNGQLGRGGAEHQLVQLAIGLHQRGIGVTVACFRGGAREGGLREAGVEFVRLNPFREGWRRVPGLPILMAALRLYRVLRRTRAEVVHGFLFQAYVLSAVVSRAAGTAVSITGRRSLARYKQGQRILLMLDGLADRCADGIIANAEAVAQDAVEVEGVARDKIAVIPNCLPPVASISKAGPVAEFAHQSVDLFNTANLYAYKGQRYLIEAAALLARRGYQVRVSVAGEGPEREALLGQAQKLGVDLQLLGRIEDVASRLSSTDVYVHSSLEEGMSNAILEAMAAGLPIVATDVGGTKELLEDGGLLVPSSDPDAIAAAVVRIIENRDEALALGQRAKRRAQAEFSRDVMVQRHLNLYGHLLEFKCVE